MGISTRLLLIISPAHHFSSLLYFREIPRQTDFFFSVFFVVSLVQNTLEKIEKMTLHFVFL